MSQLKLNINSTYKLNSGFSIPVVAYGTYQLDPEVSEENVYNALKAGYRHIDSAQLYGNEAEVVKGIAKFLKEFTEVKRSDIFYTTKIDTKNHGYEKTKKSLENSLLKAASIDYIDLVLIHNPLSDKSGRLSTYQALQEYAEKGDKVKSIGVSNYGQHHLEELFNYENFKITPAVNQLSINPWLTRKDLVTFCKSKEIIVEAYSALTRKLKTKDSIVQELSEKYKKTPEQILLRWSVQSGFLPLAKTAHANKYAKTNINIFDFELSNEDLKKLTHDEDYFVPEPSFDPPKWHEK